MLTQILKFHLDPNSIAKDQVFYHFSTLKFCVKTRLRKTNKTILFWKINFR